MGKTRNQGSGTTFYEKRKKVVRVRLPAPRASSEEQKEERRQAILDMTWQMFQASSYDDITMIDIARAMGLVKGTLYRCFKCKEELFLTLLEQKVSDWFAEINAWLLDIHGSCSLLHLTALFCQSLDARQGMLQLLSIMHTKLERAVEDAMFQRYHHRLAEHIAHTGALLEQRLPFLAVGQGRRLLIQSHMLAIGIWQACNSTPVELRLEQDSENRVFGLEFSDLFYTLLIGIERQNQITGERFRAHPLPSG